MQHAVSDRFGIRKIEVSATEFRLNGEPVRLVGFNRVADDAGKYGNTEPDVLVNADVDLMKRAGANMQRINCVPQATSLLNRMDEKGMMIVVGIPVWGDDPQTTVVDNPLTKQWLREMIERDYNHPCIIGWEVANESYQYLGYHENMMDYVRKELDPHRLVTFTSWNSYRTDIAGTENQPVEQADLPMINMYRTFTEKLATQAARWPNKPFFLSECGMYQLKGGINADFDPDFVPGWESFARGQFPNLIGASLWCFNDYRSNYPQHPAHRLPVVGRGRSEPEAQAGLLHHPETAQSGGNSQGRWDHRHGENAPARPPSQLHPQGLQAGVGEGRTDRVKSPCPRSSRGIPPGPLIFPCRVRPSNW